MSFDLGLFNCSVPAVLSGLLTVPTFDEFEAGLDGYSQGDYNFPEDGRVNPLGWILENEPSSEVAIGASDTQVDVTDWFDSEASGSFQTIVMSPLVLECPGAPCKAGLKFIQDSLEVSSFWLGSPVLGSFQTPIMDSPQDLKCPGAPCKAGVEFAPDSFSMEDIICDDSHSLSAYLFADISCFNAGLQAFCMDRNLVRRKAIRRPCRDNQHQ